MSARDEPLAVADEAPTHVAGPWDALLLQGHRLPDLPRTASMVVVYEGRRINSAADAWAACGLIGPHGGRKLAIPAPGSHLQVPDADRDAQWHADYHLMVHTARGLIKDVELVGYRTRHQRRKDDPDEQARRATWESMNKATRAAYKKKWDAENAERLAEMKRAWAARDRAANPDKHRAHVKAYQERHREAINARQKARRAAKNAQPQMQGATA